MLSVLGVAGADLEFVSGLSTDYHHILRLGRLGAFAFVWLRRCKTQVAPTGMVLEAVRRMKAVS